jgi:xylulokinase
MAVVVGVDSSTSACKVEARDADSGALVASGRAPHPATTPPRSEQLPRDWWSALSSLLDHHAAGAAAVAVAAQQHGMVVLDERREVLRPAKLWNDTESAPQAARLVDELGAEKWATLTGSVPVASFTVTKLAWLREHEPEVFDRVRHVVLPHDWLTFRLTGELVTDRGDASGTGYWSPAEGEYASDVLQLIGLDTAMAPTVLGPTSAAGSWDGAVVGPGTGDNMAAALGLGLRPGDLALSLGTSGTAFTASVAPSADPTGAVAGFADATGRYLPLVCTLNATKVTDAFARLLGMSTARFDELALAAPPGAGGVVLVPHFDGERTPNRPGATGALRGLRSDVTPEQLARAAVEGVVCNLLEAADALEAEGSVFLIGGGAHSAAYRRVVADLTGRAVTVPATEELVACGAAVQAAAVLHGRSFDELAEAWGLGRGDVVEPDPTVDRDAIRGAYADARGDRATEQSAAG